MTRPGSPAAEPYDVVVVGAGLAGNAAALTAAEAGASVLLLEKGDRHGGTSVKAGGGLVFAGTDLQAAAGVTDDVDGLRAALVQAGRGLNDPDTVEAYLDHQLEVFEWLRARGVVFDYRADLQPPHLNRLHGTAPGQATEALHEHVLADPRIEYRPRTAAVRLERDGHVTHVHLRTGNDDVPMVSGRAVVLASGGFTRSDELLRVFAPQWLTATRMGGAHNTGDGLRMAWALGADMADMAHVEPSFGASVPGFPDLSGPDGTEPTLLYANAQGAMIVNTEARRFVDESRNYKQISVECARQPDGLAFQIFDRAVMDRSSPAPSPADFRAALADGRVLQASTVGDLAALLGLDVRTLVVEVDRYNAYADQGVDPDFGRPLTGPGARIDTAPFYAYPCRNGLTTTYCGVRVDRQLRVLDVYGDPITGLHAAGEVVGGFHGGGYYSGTALGKAAVFGRAAGLSATGGTHD